MTDRELLEQALEALQAVKEAPSKDEIQRAWIVCNLLQKRLAQPERTHWEGCEEVHPECRKQEPVAWMYVNMDGECEQIEYIENEPMPDDPSITPLYTAPQPAPTIDKAAAIRIATVLGWVPPSDTSTERVDETAKQQQEQSAKEYERGYADAMGWKLQNHLEHLPSGLEAAVKAEREACAELVWPTHQIKTWSEEELTAMTGAFNRAQEKHGWYETIMAVGAAALKGRAAAIRARGQE